MSSLDFNQIPGYVEAVKAEQSNRDLVFLKDSLPICGIPVRHMNARHWILLIGCKNKFVVGGIPSFTDVEMFIWFISPEYTAGEGEYRTFIGDKVKKIDFIEACRDIYSYLGRTFQDCPQSESKDKQYTAPIASIVDLLASQYGWTEDHILEMPLAVIFQQLRRIDMRLNPKHPQFNTSEKFISQWLANEALKKE